MVKFLYYKYVYRKTKEMIKSLEYTNKIGAREREWSSLIQNISITTERTNERTHNASTLSAGFRHDEKLALKQVQQADAPLVFSFVSQLMKMLILLYSY